MFGRLVAAVSTALAILVIPAVASAHVVVKPAEVGIGSFQTFTTSVPNEKKDNPTVAVRLVIPSGLQYVQPTVKPGWTIEEKTSDNGEFPTVTEISWTGGSIPSGQRDDFTFSAQVPAKPTTLHWKAYQTYADGTVVAWDQTPNGNDEEGSTPYSQTKVIDDLKDTDAATKTEKSDTPTGAYILSGLALLVAIFALATKRK